MKKNENNNNNNNNNNKQKNDKFIQFNKEITNMKEKFKEMIDLMPNEDFLDTYSIFVQITEDLDNEVYDEPAEMDFSILDDNDINFNPVEKKKNNIINFPLNKKENN